MFSEPRFNVYYAGENLHLVYSVWDYNWPEISLTDYWIFNNFSDRVNSTYSLGVGVSRETFFFFLISFFGQSQNSDGETSFCLPLWGYFSWFTLSRRGSISQGLRFVQECQIYLDTLCRPRPFARETAFKRNSRLPGINSGPQGSWLLSTPLSKLVFLSPLWFMRIFFFCIVMPLLLCMRHLKRYLETFHIVFLVSL